MEALKRNGSENGKVPLPPINRKLSGTIGVFLNHEEMWWISSMGKKLPNCDMFALLRADTPFAVTTTTKRTNCLRMVIR